MIVTGNALESRIDHLEEFLERTEPDR